VFVHIIEILNNYWKWIPKQNLGNCELESKEGHAFNHGSGLLWGGDLEQKKEKSVQTLEAKLWSSPST
jgi:hypothetical protein